MDADDLAGLYGAAFKQQEAATEAINDLAKERVQLNATIEALQNASKGIQKAAGDAAAKAVTETLDKAPKTAQTAFNAATDALDIAVGKVRDAGAWLTWQFAVVFILVGVAAVLTNYALGRFTLPDRAEIDALRSEKAELEANIADLHKRGAKIKINTCGGRICIEASTNQGKDTVGNPAPMGSWLTTDGRKVPLVIPRGY
jgi:cell division protein FtsB